MKRRIIACCLAASMVFGLAGCMEEEGYEGYEADNSEEQYESSEETEDEEYYSESETTYSDSEYGYPYDNHLGTAKELEGKTFEEYIVSKIDSYAGKTDKELCAMFDRDYNNNKAQWIDLAYRMLGIKSNKAEEFAKAQIVVKAIRLEENGTMRENSPLPALNFKELVSQDWEDSDLFTYFDETKFLFVVFRRHGGTYTLKGAQLWNMPYMDLNETVYQGWEDIRKVVSDGVIFTKVKQKNGTVIKNNLPKKGFMDKSNIGIKSSMLSEAYFVARRMAVCFSG